MERVWLARTVVSYSICVCDVKGELKVFYHCSEKLGYFLANTLELSNEDAHGV